MGKKSVKIPLERNSFKNPIKEDKYKTDVKNGKIKPKKHVKYPEHNVKLKPLKISDLKEGLVIYWKRKYDSCIITHKCKVVSLDGKMLWDVLEDSGLVTNVFVEAFNKKYPIPSIAVPFNEAKIEK